MGQRPLDKHSRAYRYYLLGDVMPILVTFNPDGLKIGAETPDNSAGGLVIRNALLSRIERSPEVKEITREAFDIRCEEALKKRLAFGRKNCNNPDN